MVRHTLLPILLAAFLYFLSFPPFPTGVLSCFALVPLLHLLDGKKPMEGLRLGYVAGLTVFGLLFYWLNWNTGATMFQATGMYLGTVTYLALGWGVFGFLHAWLQSNHPRWAYLAVPFVWTSLDFLQSLGELGFSWHSVATSQSGYPAVLQIASITGMYGLSFWLVSLNVLIFRLLPKEGRRPAVSSLVTVAVVFVLPWILGVVVLSRSDTSGTTLRTTIVQPNIEPNRKWLERDHAFQEMIRLTAATREDKAQLVIWPETAVPNRLRNEKTKLETVRRELRERQSSLLTGIPDRRWETKEGETSGFRSYNSVFLLRPDHDTIQSYDKIHLVPFGEHVPAFLAFMKDIAMTIGVPDYSAGQDPAVFALPLFENGVVVDSVSIAPVVCLESVYSHMVRACVVRGAVMLVVVTNDAWYDGTTGPFQHHSIAALRAVENRIPVARCANSGVSSVFDPYGRVIAATANPAQSVFTVDIPLSASPGTFFTRIGWLFPWAVCTLTAAGVCVGLVHSRRRRRP